MAEYIEREALIGAMQAYQYDTGKDGFGIMALIGVQPAANVVEVVRSRWKYFRKQGIAVCMNCSFERKLDDNFGRAISCPNCGARMDGDG